MKTIKHDHLLTKLLKVFIFSLMMLLPFMIWLPNGFYYGFNETAVAQEKTEYTNSYYQTNDVYTYEDLHIDHIYHFDNGLSANYGDTAKTLFTIYPTDTLYFIEDLETIRTIYLYYAGITHSLRLEVVYLDLDQPHTYYDTTRLYFDFVISDLRGDISFAENFISSFSKSNLLYSYDNHIDNTYTMSITDSMSYAWQSVWSNNLMSWTNNSILKTPIDNFIGVFAINSDACISNYLIYLITLTAIYVVIDIVLELFIALTHMFSRETK